MFAEFGGITMKQFTFTSQLAPIIWKYLESRQNEGYTSVHCGYYMQELDCLSKELSDAPVVTKELIDAWDLLKPYLSNRSKIVRHNAIRAFAKFAYTQDGISYVPDTSKLKNSSTFTPHIFTVEEIRRLLYAADNLPVRNNAAKASPVLEPQNISPHVLRHTKAMHLLRAGVNMIYIRDFLGHADISTTEVYARIDAEMKRKVFEEKVPNYTPNTTMPWEEDEDLLQWLTQFGKKTF